MRIRTTLIKLVSSITGVVLFSSGSMAVGPRPVARQPDVIHLYPFDTDPSAAPYSNRQPECLDQYEPNESFTNAWFLSPGTIESYVCCDPEVQDLDYFKFSAYQGDLIQLKLTDLPADFDLCLYDPFEQLLDCSNNGGTATELIEKTAEIDGDHYAYVYGVQGACSSDGSYTFSLDVIPPAPGPELPDLVITDVWNNDDAICYQVRNIGEAVAPGGHHTSLSIDDEPRKTDLVTAELPPGERHSSCFEYGWQCSSSQDVIRVCADAQSVVPETDEANNCREEIRKCDTTPPTITSGPTVSSVTQSQAVISWATDQDSDSVVEFDRFAGTFAYHEDDAQLTQNHEVTLAGLSPSTVYHYIVRSADASGNEVVSREGFFETSPVPDSQPPTVSSLTITEREAAVKFYDIAASASDDVGVERVEFYLDDTLLGTDYSAPFVWPLVPATLEMSWGDIFGGHEVEALAFDSTTSVAEVLGFDPPYECEEILLEFRFPPSDHTLYTEGDTVPAGTMVPIEVYAARPGQRCEPTFVGYPDSVPDYICQDATEPVSRVAFYVNLLPQCNRYPSPDPGFDHTYTCEWDAGGYPRGRHAILVDAIASEDCKQTAIRYVTVERGEPSLDLERTVTRVQNYYRVELTLSNNGTATTADFDRILDNVTGFQPVERAGHAGSYDYDVRSECVEYSRTCDVEIDLYDASGTSIRLGPGESLHLEYLAVPILYSLLDSIDVDDYAIGRAAARVVTTLDLERARFERPWRPHASVWEAVGAADYLIVTNPYRLFGLYAASDVNDLLSAMAELAQLRGGVLGYLAFGSLTANAVDDDIEAWGRRLRGSEPGDYVGDYLFDGYLLLIGETEIVPAFDSSYTLIGHLRYGDVDYTDEPYANTSSVGNINLRMGRIIGDNALKLVKPLETSIAIARGAYAFDNSHAYAASGREDGANYLSFIENRRHVAGSLDDVGYGLTQDDCPTETTFFSHLENQDVVFLAGHGNWNIWDDIGASEVAGDDFDTGNARPLVFARSCQTGRYPEGRTLAEAFLEKAAAGYIGATEVSLGPWSGRLAEEFFDHWELGKTVGATLREAKIDRLPAGPWDWDENYNAYTCDIFHLFGDPKITPAATSRSTPELPVSPVPPFTSSSIAGPLSSLDVSIPLYEVTTVDGQDHVRIPGGRMIFVPGLPSVPSFRVLVDWPAGYRVQDVTLVERGGMLADTGLSIPPVIVSIDGSSVPAVGPAGDASEWWPDRDFDWTILESPAGASVLAVEMYPFYYNALTTGARFYQDYSFEIHYISPTVEIMSLTTDKDAYVPGDDARIDLWLNNAGDEQDVIVSAVIKPENSEDVADGLLLRSLNGLKGFASFSAQWDTGGFEPGNYSVEAEIKDTAGNVLHRAVDTFGVGISAGEISTFTATPTAFDIGDTMDIFLVFDNTGTMPISGTAVIQVQYETGSPLAEFRHDFSNLAPANAISFEDHWDTSAVGEGTYRIVGYVSYDARATNAQVVLVGTSTYLYLPVVHRSHQ